MPDEVFCPNCDAPISGAFCSACGQHQDYHGASLPELLREAFREVTDADARLVRTFLTLLLFPGRVTRDHLERRRARYMPPFRTYLIANVILYFILDAFLRLGYGTFRADVDLGSGSGSPAVTLSGEQLGHALMSYLPQLGFVLLPVAAALLKLLYVRRGIAFGDHLVASLHIKAGIAAWLVLGLILLAGLLAIEHLSGANLALLRTLLGDAIPIVVTAYVLLSMHRVYGGRILLSLLRGFALSSSYLVFATAGIVVLMIVLRRFAGA